MKHNVIIAALALALSACGGNYSNEDLAYLNALPTRQQLQSDVPGTATSTGALQQRRDGLAVGERSKTYTDTKKISVEFNQFLEFFLGVIEGIRKHPPTSREDNRRVWGPFPAEKNPGWNVQVVMVRADETHFDWFIEFRKTSAAKRDPWLVGMSGKFVASSGIRKGQGEMHLFLDKLRAEQLTDGKEGNLNTVDVTYVTDQPPLSVDMTLAASDGNSLDYSFREYEPGRASMFFVLDQPKVGLQPASTLNVRSGWNKDGAGRATIFFKNRTTGEQATGLECWDASFNVVYFSHPWETTAPKSGGDDRSCVTVEGVQ